MKRISNIRCRKHWNLYCYFYAYFYTTNRLQQNQDISVFGSCKEVYFAHRTELH